MSRILARDVSWFLVPPDGTNLELGGKASIPYAELAGAPPALAIQVTDVVGVLDELQAELAERARGLRRITKTTQRKGAAR